MKGLLSSIGKGISIFLKLNSLKKLVGESYAIGDCKEPGLTVDAISDGSRIAREI